MFRKPAKAIAATILSNLVLLVALPTTGRAGFVTVGQSTDTSLEFSRAFQWTFPAQGGQVDTAGPFIGKNNDWTVVQLNSPAPPNNAVSPRDLDVRLQHAPNEEGGKVGANPDEGLLTFKGVQAGVTRTSLNKIGHGPGTSDFFFGSVGPDRFNDRFSIQLKGKHYTGGFQMTASFKNDQNHPVSGDIIPSYLDPTVPGFNPFMPKSSLDESKKTSFKDLQPGKETKATLPTKEVVVNGEKLTLPPTDFQVRASGSGTTTTTLAFLGTAEGVSGVTELEMAPLSLLLVGEDEWLAPDLLDASGGDLEVFVNLTQWLGSGATFTGLQSFSLSDGVSDDLPGVFVSTTPITVNNDGSLQGTPFDGQVFVGGTIDGQAVAVPAPSGLVLALAGMVSLAPFALRGCRSAVRRAESRRRSRA